METDRRVAPRADWWWVGPALGWLAVQLVITVFALVQMFFSTFSVASCTATSCDYPVFLASVNTLYMGATALLGLSALAVFLVRRRGRVMIWPPIVGSALLMILLSATYIAGRAALTLPLFGNRLSDY